MHDRKPSAAAQARRTPNLRTVEGRIEHSLNIAEDSKFWRTGVYLERLADSSEVTRVVAQQMVSGWIGCLSSLSRAYRNGRMSQEQATRFIRVARSASPCLNRAIAAGFTVQEELLQQSRP